MPRALAIKESLTVSRQRGSPPCLTPRGQRRYTECGWDRKARENPAAKAQPQDLRQVYQPGCVLGGCIRAQRRSHRPKKSNPLVATRFSRPLPALSGKSREETFRFDMPVTPGSTKLEGVFALSVVRVVVVGGWCSPGWNKMRHILL